MVPGVRTLILMSLAAVLVVGSGCKKKQPSEDFTQASKAFAVLYGAQLDGAFTHPSVDGIVEQLRRVPEDSLDAQSAKELIARIEAGKAKAAAERSARDAAQAQMLKQQAVVFAPSTNSEVRPADTVAPAAVPDAGSKPVAPRLGMRVSEFDKAFGDCFEAGPSITLQGAGSGPAESRMLRDYNRCRDLVPGFDQKYVLFQNGLVVNIMNKSDIRTVTVQADGGMFDAGQ